ncbi:MAG TPA: putative quinol monooxygenase [Kiritimatiellia bacterium]|nr:putative quinol monooxygenase [Kiritimatiellia bacterium]HMO99058.1 putative quinol monooxygenase [Kiritimatiellia bacterium]HMP97587.1 putative quinol monooxygenase [Kiritimatiellia bacterium]
MSLLMIHVAVHVRPGGEHAFIAATRENARQSRQEPGVVRFDLLQDSGDSRKFLLVEIYRSPEAAAAHKETAHYLAWRDAVADLMAEPRASAKYLNLDPDDHGWS